MTEIITGGCLCGSVSGNVSSRGFCPTWGSPIVFKTSGLADFVFLTAGSLDDPSLFEPGMVVFPDSAQGWDHIDPSLRRFPRMPNIRADLAVTTRRSHMTRVETIGGENRK